MTELWTVQLTQYDPKISFIHISGFLSAIWLLPFTVNLLTSVKIFLSLSHQLFPCKKRDLHIGFIKILNDICYQWHKYCSANTEYLLK